MEWIFFIGMAALFVFLVSKIQRAPEERRQLWQQLATMYQGELQLPGRRGEGKERARFTYRGVDIELSLRQEKRYQHPRVYIDTYQVMAARLPIAPNLIARVKRDDRMLRALRPQDIQVDDAPFDEHFLVESNAPEWLKQALQQAPELRALHFKRAALEVDVRSGKLTVTRFNESLVIQDLEDHLRLTSLYISALTQAALPPQQGW